ncbi:MAG: hypothetical protein WBA10_19015 [Elainellaceae cyanobacterium]
MNESTSSSGDRVNFPSAIGADAGERQTEYRERRQSSGRGDAVDKGRKGAKGADAAAIASQTEALITLVQELTQQNHLLSDQVAQLEGTIASLQESAAAAPSQALPSDASTDAQVAYLLNQLEFAQQTNQRQVIRAESLVQQVNTDRLHLRQLEQDNAAFQHRCRTQTSHIDQLEQRCNELQQRLQRQQDYTLQLKAALDKCLEVPPPSYATPEGLDVNRSEPVTLDQSVSDRLAPTQQPIQQMDQTITAQPTKGKATSPTTLTSPLLPKAGDIPPWSQSHSAGSKGSPTGTQRSGAIKAIEPLKPALQVPQMSRFKTTLFNLAHQPQPTTASPDSGISHDLHGRDSVVASESSTIDSAMASSPESRPSQSEAAKPASASSALSPTPNPETSASTEDAFWADLVQLVAEIDPIRPLGDGATADDNAPSQPSAAAPPPVVAPSPSRKPKSQDMAQGVDTLFDVVLQGAKAIANQFKASEDNALGTGGTARLEDEGAPFSGGAASTSSQFPPPPPPPDTAKEALDQTAIPQVTGESSPPPPSTSPTSVGWPSPQLSQTPSRSSSKASTGRRRIDLPTFLRPQPQ